MQKKLGITARYSTFALEALKTSVLIWGMFMSSSMKAASHLGPIFFANLGSLQGHELRGNSEIIQYHTEIDTGAFWRDSECTYDWKHISLMDEIDIVSWSSAQNQKYVKTQIPNYVWERCMMTEMELQDGKVKWKNSKCPLLTKNYWESMEKQLNFNSHIGSSSCQCSMTSIGQENETMEFVLRIQKKSRHMRRDSCKDIGRSSVLETKKKW